MNRQNIEASIIENLHPSIFEPSRNFRITFDHPKSTKCTLSTLNRYSRTHRSIIIIIGAKSTRRRLFADRQLSDSGAVRAIRKIREQMSGHISPLSAPLTPSEDKGLRLSGLTAVSNVQWAAGWMGGASRPY